LASLELLMGEGWVGPFCGKEGRGEFRSVFFFGSRGKWKASDSFLLSPACGREGGKKGGKDSKYPLSPRERLGEKDATITCPWKKKGKKRRRETVLVIGYSREKKKGVQSHVNCSFLTDPRVRKGGEE